MSQMRNATNSIIANIRIYTVYGFASCSLQLIFICRVGYLMEEHKILITNLAEHSNTKLSLIKGSNGPERTRNQGTRALVPNYVGYGSCDNRSKDLCRSKRDIDPRQSLFVRRINQKKYPQKH